MVHRTPYYISFLLVFLIFVSIFLVQFDRVFDVMLQSISSPRREAASSPHPRRTTLKKVVTNRALQLHAVNTVTLRTLQFKIVSKLIFKRRGWLRHAGDE
jgi:hypothetical protein